MRLVLPIAIAGSVLAAASPARATSAGTAIAVTRGPGASDCPDAGALAARATAAGSRTPFVAGRDGTGDVVVAFEKEGDARHATIAAPGGKRRALDDRAADCDGLAEAVVLALLLSADGNEEETPPERAPSIAAERPSPPDAARAAELRIEVGGVASFGAIRAAAPGAVLGAHAGPRGGAWSIGVVGLWLPSSDVALGAGTAHVAYLGGGVEGCGRHAFATWLGGEACARGEAGVMQGSADGFATNEAHDRPLVSAALVLRGVFAIGGPASGFVEGAVRAPLHREQFAIAGAGTVYDAPVVGAGAAAGIAWTFR